MAPRKPNKKKAMALLAELGIELKPEDFAPGKAPKEEFRNAMPGRKYSQDQEMIQAESVLLSLIKMPKEWFFRKCGKCGEGFYTNYYFVGYCGDQCRALALKKMGITWTNHFDESAKWGGMTPPIVIPPEALKVMEFLVEQAKQETPRLVEMPKSEPKPLVSSELQMQSRIEHPNQNENVQVLPDNTDEVPETPIVQESEDDFLSILAALDV